MIKIKHAVSKADAGKKGLHLLKPTAKELDDAKYFANAKGVKVIYIHLSRKTWDNQKGVSV